MSSWAGTPMLAAALWLALAALGAPLLGIAWRWRARRMRTSHPATRARAAEAVAWGATGAPTVALLLVVLPGLLALLGGGDHCRRHAEHLHLCLVHPAAALPPAAIAAVSAAWLAFALRSVWRLLPDLHGFAASRELAALHRIGRDAVERVRSERLFSITTGAWRPRIWISDRLWRALSPEQLAVVLAHERAHARRRDPLRRAAIAVLSLPLGAATRVRLLRSWTLASEQACDEEAARAVGDRVRVAEAVLAVERLLGGSERLPVRAPSFGGGDVERRVRSLLAPDAAISEPRRGRRALAVAAAGLCLAGSGVLHHVAEHLIDAVFGAR